MVRERSDFQALFDILAPLLYAWGELRIPASLKSRLDADDLLQEVWWRARDSFPTFDSAKGTFRAWVFQIASRTLLNAHRAARARMPRSPAGAQCRIVALPEHLLAEATSISRQASRAEGIERLAKEVSRLDREERALFIHCALEGATAERAALLIGISVSAASKRWQRLREQLQGELRSAGIHPEP